MIKLRDILNEIGDGSSKVFDYYQSSGSGFLDMKNFKLGTSLGIVNYGAYIAPYFINADVKGKPLNVALQAVKVSPKDAKEADPEVYDKYKSAVAKLGLDLDNPEIANNYVDLYVEFNAHYPDEKMRAQYDEPILSVNDKTYLLRLMATIKEIMLELVNKHNANVISYTPLKGGNEEELETADLGRTKLYSIFIKNAFPGSKRIVDEDLVLHLIKPVK